MLRGARRPVFIAGRGAPGRAGRASARAELERLADACGALLATSAVAKGLFRGNPWDLDVSGGFASPLAAELISGADLIVGWGCSLNMWTMRHGKLIGTGATLIQVDDDPTALGAHRPVAPGRARRRRRDRGRRRGRAGAAARAWPAGDQRPVATGRRVAGGGAGTGRRSCGSGSRGGAVAGRAVRPTRATGSGSIRARCPSRWMTCCPPSAPWRWTPGTSWVTRACTCRSRTRRASASPRRSSRSAWASPRPSAPRSRGRTGWRSPRSATAAR